MPVIGLLAAIAMQHMPDRTFTPTTAASSIPMDLAGLDLRDGDLVLRAGLDMAARIILMQGSETVFSHVGVIVISDGKPMVAHAMPQEPGSTGGVILEKLEQFFAPDKAANIGAYRLNGAGQAERAAIRAYAISQIGKPFDDEFSMQSNDRMYCTELVIKAALAGGFDLKASLQPVKVMTINEPIYAPDTLRHLTALTPAGNWPHRQQP